MSAKVQSLYPGSEHYTLGSDPPTLFLANKVLLEQSHTHSFTRSPWLLSATTTGCSNYNRDHALHKALNMYSLSFPRKNFPILSYPLNF